MTKIFAIAARATAVALAAGLVSASAVAETTPAAPAKAQDRNQKICQTIEVTGSRLGTRRVCKTRAEWDDARLQDRQEVERVQIQRGTRGE